MKLKLFAIAFLFILAACKDNTPASGAFGAKFDNNNAIAFSDALANYNAGKDTTYNISGTIENSCQHKGCWLTFKAADGSEFYINNDEKFVMPSNAKGHKATANGHFVKDDKGEVSFLTTGVVIE
ncbi:MAG: DUF4920 domain-containing protein [bacterium]|nr:DUF4920 domain-containing protein [bacterium]